MPKKLLPRSEFARNVATLMTGTTIAQAIPIAFSPILTRLYTPEDFGVLAIFISISTIFGIIVSGKYELAILVAEEDENAINVAALSLFLTAAVTFILAVTAFVSGDRIAVMLGNKDISFWLYFVPLVVMLKGTYNIARYLSIRYKNFKNIAISRTVISLVSASTKLVLGLIGAGISGLISGAIFSHVSGNVAIMKTVFEKKDLFGEISVKRMKKMAGKYSDFPKFSLPAGLANTLSLNLNSLFITSLFSTAILGQFSLVQKIVGLPTTLIANSVSDAYFQKATEERREFGNAGNIFRKISAVLLIISILMFVTLFFAGEELFVFVFGDAWRPAGGYARIVALLFSVRLLVVPLSVTFSVFEKQKYNLFATLSQLTILLAVFLIAWVMALNINSFLVIYTAGMSLFYLSLYFVAYKIASKGV